MIAKGHDFPRVTLVGVISADVGLGLADFRARSGRFSCSRRWPGAQGAASEPGEAIMQTLYPKHYSIRHRLSQDYTGVLRRRARRSGGRCDYPPAVALINVVVADGRSRPRHERRGRSRPRDCGQRAAGSGGAGTRTRAPRPVARAAPRAVASSRAPSARRCAVQLVAALGRRPEIARRTHRGRRSDERAVAGSRNDFRTSMGTGVKQRTKHHHARRLPRRIASRTERFARVVVRSGAVRPNIEQHHQDHDGEEQPAGETRRSARPP